MEQPSNIIIRRRRLDRLTEILSDCRILYVQAPAGYGKTVFAEQWLANSKEGGIAVTLDEYDNTPEDLCRKLKGVMDDLYRKNEPGRESELIRHPDFDKAPVEFLMRAAAAIQRDGKGVIVIDDLHYLTDVRAQKILKTFLKRLPEEIKVCILSRNAPPGVFSELILKNKLKFIYQEDMLFDSSEILALYKSKNIALTKKQLEMILEFTEGWPIGINALLLSKNQIPEEDMPEGWLESFLGTQVWGMWDEEAREFMVATCMEDELTEGLCDALTERDGSKRMLERLMAEGAFLFRQRDGAYRFHKLFREFLKKQFLARPEEYRREKIWLAGKWYREHNDFYHAVERFSYIKDYEQTAECFDTLEYIERTGFDTEQVMHVVSAMLDEEIVKEYPYLYFMKAFTARNKGNIEKFKYYADKYYENYPCIVSRNPELAHNIFFLYAMDFRFTLRTIAEMAASTQTSMTFQGVRGSATSYFPLYHRSFRDFSELMPGDMNANLDEIGQVLGPLLGSEGSMILKAVRAGLYYEMGKLQHAQELILLSAAEMRREFVPESKFCVMVLLLIISHAMGQDAQEEIIQKDIQKMIDQDKVYYLQFNFDAVAVKNRLDCGDAEAARGWLENRGTDIYAHLDFFRLYGHFTTARAYIALGDFNQAIILLEKILAMCRAMKRTVDIIEAELLLAVAFWKKKRGNLKKALAYLEDAVTIAQEYEYEQVFINEGAELATMLSNLKSRTIRSDYEGSLSETFVKRLYIGAAEQAHNRKGLTGGRVEQGIKFTPQQKKVMSLMCEGYGYQKIAEELGIQFSTVRSHIELIYRKLDVSDMKEAILKIRRLHILEEV